MAITSKASPTYRYKSSVNIMWVKNKTTGKVRFIFNDMLKQTIETVETRSSQETNSGIASQRGQGRKEGVVSRLIKKYENISSNKELAFNPNKFKEIREKKSLESSSALEVALTCHKSDKSDHGKRILTH